MIKNILTVEIDIMHKIHEPGRPHIRSFLDAPYLLLTLRVVGIEMRIFYHRGYGQLELILVDLGIDWGSPFSRLLSQSIHNDTAIEERMHCLEGLHIEVVIPVALLKVNDQKVYQDRQDHKYANNHCENDLDMFHERYVNFLDILIVNN